MAKYNGRILFIDGFAGPGRYEGGEEGSPIIALRTLLEHPHFSLRGAGTEVCFLFIEELDARARVLSGEVELLKERKPFPEWIKFEVKTGKFAEHMTTLLDEMDSIGQRLAPALAFIDPFGFGGIPLSLIARIAKNQKSECLITFMYEPINRFLDHPNPKIQATLEEVFGTPEARSIAAEQDPMRRFERITGLYQRQLHDVAGFRYVRSFAMVNEGNRVEYLLCFGTNDLTGLSRMKTAMWKADPDGTFSFSDRTDPNQTVLFSDDPSTGLGRMLQHKFRDKGFVSIETIEAFVLEATPYLEKSHLKRKTLQPMEKVAEIEVRRPAGKKKVLGQYPEGTRIKFV